MASSAALRGRFFRSLGKSVQPIHKRNIEAGAVLIIVRGGAESFADGGEVIIKLSVERNFVTEKTNDFGDFANRSTVLYSACNCEEIEMTVLEKEMKDLRNEVRGLRSLIMGLVDPDAGLELTADVKKRIRAARKSTAFLSTDDVLKELRT